MSVLRKRLSKDNKTTGLGDRLCFSNIATGSKPERSRILSSYTKLNNSPSQQYSIREPGGGKIGLIKNG